ncbi:hypothetical protein ACRCPS_17850 [Pseudomonas aeruginosa]
MKIFVISHQAQGDKDISTLANLLNQVEVEQGMATPVVLVERLHREADLEDKASRQSAGSTPKAFSFHVEAFVNQSLVTTGDTLTIDPNLVAKHLQAVPADWVVMDLAQHQPATMIDLLTKVARFRFMSEHLANRNLVLVVPDLYLSFIGRTANEAFNNLPIGAIEIERSAQTKMLLMSASIERVIIGLPLLTRPLLRFQRLALQVYRRLIRTT